MGANKVRHDRDEGHGPRPRTPQRAVGIQGREDLQRQGQAEVMDGHEHVSSPATTGPTNVRGIPCHALFERSEAFQLQHEIVQEQSEGGGGGGGRGLLVDATAVGGCDKRGGGGGGWGSNAEAEMVCGVFSNVLC
jgi:hypothetical protein